MTTIIEIPSSTSSETVDIARPIASQGRTVTVCDTQPVIVEGLRSMFAGTEDIRLVSSKNCLPEITDWVQSPSSDILILDKGFGIHAILAWLAAWRRSSMFSPNVGVIVWGMEMNEPDALRLFQAGVRGILRKTEPISSVLSCIRGVAEGHGLMVDGHPSHSEAQARFSESKLTAREQQVLRLAERGLRNKEIAVSLGINVGTVKIHMKHIFQKSGVRGRYGLALRGLQRWAPVSLTA